MRDSGKNSLLVAGLGFGVAAGVALGALVLAPNISGGQVGTADDAIRTEHQKTVQDNRILSAQADSGDKMVEGFAPDVVSGTLKDRPVLVIATSDAAEGDVAGVEKLLESAGSRSAGRIELTQNFFIQDKADELKSLVATTLPAGASLSKDAMDAGTHAGEALAAAVMLNPTTTEPLASVEDRAALLQTLRKAEFLTYKDGTILPAQAVVVVSGKGTGGYGADTLAHFANAFEEVGKSTVLAAPVEQAAPEGAIGKLRGDKSEVTTVDSINRAWARTAAVLATAEQLSGGAGSYGAAESAEADAPKPPAKEGQ